jgi:hypothetical protein
MQAPVGSLDTIKGHTRQQQDSRKSGPSPLKLQPAPAERTLLQTHSNPLFGPLAMYGVALIQAFIVTETDKNAVEACRAVQQHRCSSLPPSFTLFNSSNTQLVELYNKFP